MEERADLSLGFVYCTAIVVLWLCILSMLGVDPVFQVSEAREGSVIQAVSTADSFSERVLPLRHGSIIPSKPPLYHWLSSFVVFDFLSVEFQLRFLSFLSASLLLFLVYVLECRVAPKDALKLSPLILLSMYGFLRLSSDGRVDMLFASLCFLSITRVLLGLWHCLDILEGEWSQSFRSVVRDSALFLGLAVLAKGPTAYVIVGLAVVISTFVFLGTRGLKSLISWRWTFAFLLPLPWYLFGYVSQGAGFVDRHLWLENFRRVSGGADIVSKPWWFYLEHIWTQAAPWSFIALSLLLLTVLPSWRSSRFLSLECFPERKTKLLVKSLLGWMFVLFLLISFSSGKRRAYLLPLLPAFAVCLSLFLSSWLEQGYARAEKLIESCRRFRAFLALFYFAFILLLLFAGSLVAYGGDWFSADLIRVLGSLDETIALAPVRFLIIGVLLPALFFLPAIRKISGHRKQIVLSICFLSLFLMGQIFFWGGLKGITHSYRSFAVEVASTLPDEKLLSFVKKEKDESYDGFLFYYQKPFELVFADDFKGAKRFFLAKVSVASELEGSYDYLLSGGRKTDLPEEKLVLFREESSSLFAE